MNFMRRHKNPFIVLLVLLTAVSAYAVDTKLTALSELATADNDDLIYVVDDPNGTPAGYKITRQEFLLSWVGSANITTLGTIATGTWQGTAIADAYVPDTITVSNYLDLATYDSGSDGYGTATIPPMTRPVGTATSTRRR